ncbi:hypothetical protein P4204_07960 [Pseudomonas aeruginosa]|nr:hypothetical protein [Pseudomonas aeruginosa]
MRHLTLATTQFACSWSLDDNLDRAERLVREAAARARNWSCCRSCSPPRTSASSRTIAICASPKPSVAAGCWRAFPAWRGSLA